MDPYIELLDMGLGLFQLFLGKLHNKLPAEVLAAIQAAIDAIAVHRNDEITKGSLESQRG